MVVERVGFKAAGRRWEHEKGRGGAPVGRVRCGGLACELSGGALSSAPPLPSPPTAVADALAAASPFLRPDTPSSLSPRSVARFWGVPLWIP